MDQQAQGTKIETEDVAARAVVGTFTATLQVTQQRTLQITGHIYDIDTPDSVNRRIDMYQDSIDRQFVRCDILNKEAQVKAMTGAIAMWKEQLADIMDKHNESGNKKLPSAVQQQVENNERSMTEQLKNIERLNADISAARHKLGMAA